MTSKAASTIAFADGEIIKMTYSLNAYINTISGEGDGAISFKSDNALIARVDSTTGAVTMIGIGTVTVTATKSGTATHDPVEASYTLTIAQIASTIVLADGVNITKVLGDVPFSNAVTGIGDGNLSYSSSTPSVATVDSVSGLVTILSGGTTVITINRSAAVIYTEVNTDFIVKVNTLPTINTTAIAGNLTLAVDIAGTGTIIERGICWSVSKKPSTAGTCSSVVGGVGAFDNAPLTNLTQNTTYYVRAYAINSSGTSYGEDVSFNSGRTFGALHSLGYVFYNDGLGGGMVVGQNDLASNSNWSNITNNVVGTGTAIGRGAANTTAIMNQAGHTASAASLCRAEGADWFLPSQDELDLIYVNLSGASQWNMTDAYYWTSSEEIDNHVWVEDMGNRYKYAVSSKAVERYVRPVREF